MRLLQFVLFTAALATAKAAPPNIVFMLADDLGYGDVRALNPDSKIPTPHMDRLAAEGITFTDAHSPSAVCTPTRYGVLTGRYCWRGKLKRGVINGYGKPVIETGRETVPSFLKKHGYTTACVGKWHLGFDFTPKEGGKGKNDFDYTKPVTNGAHTHGFDFSFVIPASLDFPPYVYIRDGKITAAPDRDQPAIPFPGFLRAGPIGADFQMIDANDKLADTAVEYLNGRGAANAEPFFLYVPFVGPHKPVIPHPRFQGKSGLGPYGDYVHQTDAMVGKILGALDANGLADDTLVFFTSDNGSFMYSIPDQPDHLDDETVQAYKPENHRANLHLRGTKADIWEAGHRVPFLARWPGKARAGSKCDKTITHTDLFATCAALVGKPLPENAAEDSFSWLPLLEAKEADFKRAPVINHSANGTFAIRDGNWKLVLGNGSGGRQQPKGKPFGEPYELYDLGEDPREKNNVATKYPDIVKRLTESCDQLREAGRSR